MRRDRSGKENEIVQKNDENGEGINETIEEWQRRRRTRVCVSGQLGRWPRETRTGKGRMVNAGAPGVGQRRNVGTTGVEEEAKGV